MGAAILHLESVLESKCIHAGGKHTDVVSLSTIHAFCRASKTTEDIAAANGYSKLFVLQFVSSS